MKRRTLVETTVASQRELGPFGRHAPKIAALTLVAFLTTTLHSSFSWAAMSERTTPARELLDRRSVQSGETRSNLEPAPNLGAGTTSRTSAAEQSSTVFRPPAGESISSAEAEVALDAAAAVANLPKASAPIAAQAISLPSGAATVSGMGESFTAQLTTGIATYNVPLSIPRARGAAQPAINLVYASSGGLGDAGLGWSLAGSMSIARQTDRGTPSYDDRADFHAGQDTFIFGGQELVPICTVKMAACAGALEGEAFPAWAEDHQYFRARIESSFLRFFWSPDHRTWRVQSKEGIHLELGASLDGSGDTSALEANPTRPQQIYRWHLARQYDSRGLPDAVPRPLPNNVVVYRYRNDGEIRYIEDIFYTSPTTNPSAAPLAEFAHHLHFVWQARADRTTSYRAGFLQTQRARLLRVDVSSKPFGGAPGAARQLLRRLHVAYEPQLHASLLASLQVEGRCDAVVSEESSGLLPNTNCARLPPLRFGYQRVSKALDAAPKDAAGLAFEPFDTRVRELGEASPPHSLDEREVALMDVDSDSLPDLIATAPGLYDGKHGLFLNGRRGALGFGTAQGMAVTGIPNVDANVLSFGNANVVPLDLDGDARVDLVHMPAERRYSLFTPQKGASGFAWVGRSVVMVSDQSPKIDLARDAGRVARVDVDSDGLMDLVFSSATELQTFFALGRFPGGDARFGQGTFTTATTAALSSEPVTSCLPWSAQPIRFDDPDVRMADVNGDGLPDIVRIRPGQMLYWPGRGNGYWGTGERDDCRAGTLGQERHLAIANAPQFGTALSGGLEIGDVNGDGLADLVEFRANAVDIYLNENGERFTDRQTLSNVPFKPSSSRYVQVTDIDGSGTPDLVWGRAFEYRYIDLARGVRPYLLTQISSGLGKVTDFEYASSAQLMLAARKAGKPWKRDLPFATPVVVRSVVRDQLDKVGRSAGAYATEYTYRDPLFDGRQREFRGFESAESRAVGDDNTPSVITRSTFLLGECRIAQSGVDVCAPADRWQDNWREPLKGRQALVEVFDENGVYLSTTHSKYELRQLYSGRDGRRVSVAYAVGQEAFSYDTAGFVASTATEEMTGVEVRLSGVVQTETTLVPKRAGAGTARMSGNATFDDFGNPLTQVTAGCVAGCEVVDESVTRHTESARVAGDDSAWLFRPKRAFVTGSVHTEARLDTHYEYDSAGDLASLSATLVGSLPLDRSHSGGGTVAPPPLNALAGTSPIELPPSEYTRDEFGNLVAQRAPLQHCKSFQFDESYADLPVAEATYGGGVDGSTGCGERLFTTSATYDRGLAAVLTSRDITDQPARFEYDSFGRLTAKFLADVNGSGQLSALPNATYEYFLPEDAATAPYSVVVAHEQDGESADDATYHDAFSYTDGLGRTLVTLKEADPIAGDGGDWIVTDVGDYDARGAKLRSYEPTFWYGDPLGFPLELVPERGFQSQQNDAFGRLTRVFGLDAQLKVFKRYHAISLDSFDALDVQPGPQQGTFVTFGFDGHGRVTKVIQRVHIGAAAAAEEHVQLRQYLPTGEILRITQRRAGSPDVVRWFRYDSQGRMVLNVEPNTSTNFTADENADPATFKAIRYAYDALGQLVGTSDARGCGVNYFYDTAGRILAEDYSPCDSTQPAYSSPSLSEGVGVETLYHYDTPDPSIGEVVDASGRGLAADARTYHGRTVSVSARGARGIVRYDARGRVTGGATQIAKPGVADDSLAARYAPRWYLTETKLDAFGRPLESSTGVTTQELLGAGDTSNLTVKYSQRGLLIESGSSYGVLSTQIEADADGKVSSFVLGDAAATTRRFAYDTLRRLKTVQSYRAGPDLWTSPAYPTSVEATQQLSLEDYEIGYDAVDNVTVVNDYRIAEEWPASAKPVSKTFEYDDLYRLTRVTSTHAASGDTWTSPYAAENADTTAAPKPAPHVSFASRTQEQTYRYDHLDNFSESGDDASGFFDRSLGVREHGSAISGPNQLVSASNRSSSPLSSSKGDLQSRYDAAGNLSSLLVRRDGVCLPMTASCWQRFEYRWDEVGRLAQAKRWDLLSAERADDLSDAPPSRTADVELRNSYDATGARIIKTAVDPLGNESHSVYINSSYELRRAVFADGEYALTPSTVSLSLSGGGVRARVVFSELDLPTLSSGQQHLFLQLNDHVGAAAFTIDHQTGELVEFATLDPYGSTESDYRPGRWGQYRDPYRFNGKEEDIEVGLVYFGARFYAPALGVWISPDPVTLHGIASGSRVGLNPYLFANGSPIVSVDPDGMLPIPLIGAIVGAVVGAAAYSLGAALGYHDWNLGEFAFATLAGAAIGATLGYGATQAGLLSAAGAAFQGAPSLFAASTWVGVGAAGLVGGGIGAAAGFTYSAFTKGTVGGMALGAARGFEAGAAAGAGAAMGYATGASGLWSGGLLGIKGSGWGVAFAITSGANGAISGYHGTYNYISGDFVLDSTWSAINTAGGVAYYVANRFAGADYDEEHSLRQGRHVFVNGISEHPGGATTFGHTYSFSNGYNDSISEHETWHIWQQRIFGIYQPTVIVAWRVVGTGAGALYGTINGDKEPWARGSIWGELYNPFELWAYKAANPEVWDASLEERKSKL